MNRTPVPAVFIVNFILKDRRRNVAPFKTLLLRLWLWITLHDYLIGITGIAPTATAQSYERQTQNHSHGILHLDAIAIADTMRLSNRTGRKARKTTAPSTN